MSLRPDPSPGPLWSIACTAAALSRWERTTSLCGKAVSPLPPGPTGRGLQQCGTSISTARVRGSGPPPLWPHAVDRQVHGVAGELRAQVVERLEIGDGPGRAAGG